MAITDLISKIILEDEFSGAFDAYNRRLVDADSNTERFGARLRGLVTVGGVAAGAIGEAATSVKELTDVAVEMEKAQTNLAVAATAANKEFGDSVGTAASWRNTVGELSKELRVFSQQELTGASTRLVDMTKRLGLNEEQMQEVLRRTADLAAGKTDLTGGVERVTAALRGEAEAAEFLGLSLNETTIMNYAEAQGLVFKELSDNEKAQLRYQVLLEQTNTLQGRAAVFAETAAGKQAALNAQYENSTALLGKQLLPLQEGAVELLAKLTAKSEQSAGIITRIQAGFVASLLTMGATATAVYTEILEGSQQTFNAIAGIFSGEGFDASVFDSIGSGLADSAEIIGKVPETYSQAFDQILGEYTKLGEVNQEFVDQTIQASKEAADNTAAVASDMAAELEEAYETAADDRIKVQEKATERLAELEFTHAQRVRRINEDINRAIAEAGAEAARAREEANRDLADGLAEVERDLAADRASALSDFNNDAARLARDRVQAERDARQDISDLERDLQQEIGDINQDLADDLADQSYKAEQDRLKIIKDFGAQAVTLEQDIANQRKAIDDEFESEFAEADPFRRKILEFNRQEQLKALDETEAAEKEALESQKTQALTELEDRVAQEAAVLEREAQQKKDRLARETEDRKAAVQQQLADQIEANEVERAELERRLAEKQAQLDTAAAEERAKLQEQHQAELTSIDEQEAAKVEKAQQALERERQNYADRRALLEFQQQQDLAAIDKQLSEVESAERDSHNRRLLETRRWSAEMQRLNALAATYNDSGSSSGASAGFGANPGTIINAPISVTNPPGTSAASNAVTGRTVQDALNGLA